MTRQPEEDVFERVVRCCRAHGLTVAVAESLTAGEIALRIASIPDSGPVFLGGVVTYASASKYRVLGLRRGPVVTEDAAAAMATGVREMFDSDLGVAATGVAGPAPQEGHRPGTLFVGAAARDGRVVTHHRLVGDPLDEPGVIRTRSAGAAVEVLLELLTASGRMDDRVDG
jgi:nicotinamide-nucleotide amidase